MLRNSFIYKIQCELSCPKSACKISGFQEKHDRFGDKMQNLQGWKWIAVKLLIPDRIQILVILSGNQVKFDFLTGLQETGA